MGKRNIFMIHQPGIKLAEFPLKELEVFEHILFHDTPILSHVQDATKSNYLAYWIDDDEVAYRWLIFKTDPIDLEAYLGGKIPFRSLVMSPKNDFVFFTDMNNGKYTNNIMVKPTDLIPDYIPEENSFYKSGIEEKYVEFFKQTLNPVSV